MKTLGYIYRPVGGVILHAYYYRDRLDRQWFFRVGTTDRGFGLRIHLGALVAGCGIEFRRQTEGDTHAKRGGDPSAR
jgi:hypothetical protein